MVRFVLAFVLATCTAASWGHAPPVPWMGPDGVPVVSAANLDAQALDRRARSELDAAAPDLRIAALLAVDAPPSPSLRILMPGEPDAASAPREVTVVAENLADDAVASVLTHLVFDRRADGRWTIASARQALLCRRGDLTDRFVKGPCP